MTGGGARALLLAAFLIPAAPAGAAEVRVLTAADGLPSNRITAVAAAEGGRLWVGTGDAGVALVDPASGKAQRFRTADGLLSDAVVSVALFRGKVYVGTSEGISIFDGARWESLAKAEGVVLRNVRIAASPDGKELWACSVYLAGGTVRFDGTAWRFMGGQGRGLFNDVQGFGFLPDGVLMGAASGGAYLHKGTDVVPLSEGLPPANVFAAAVRDGRALLGTSRGLFEYDGRWKEVPLPGATAGAAVFALAPGPGQLAVGTDRGLAVLSGGQWEAVTPEAGLPAARVTAVALSGGTVAAGTARGLALVR